ncbi:MAG TPA: hypothetical protein VNT20_10370 [Flavisolibacter sp.]|jgi:hypothetical protein|nr:hypothetical protein [Flavisolibacter sp.]
MILILLKNFLTAVSIRDWSTGTIKISVDNHVYFSFGNEHEGKGKWPFNTPFYLLLNIAVGGNWAARKALMTKLSP